MLSKADIRQRLVSSLAGGEALDSFEDWLDSESFSELRKDSDSEIRSFIARIMHAFDLHSDGYLNDSQLIAELRQIASPNEVKEVEIRFAFDGVSSPPTIDQEFAVNSQVHVFAPV